MNSMLVRVRAPSFLSSGWRIVLFQLSDDYSMSSAAEGRSRARFVIWGV